MAKQRALLTETEREQLAGDHGDQRRYEATSRVRRRVKDELTIDIQALAEHNQDLLEELRNVVCVGRADGLEFRPLGAKNISYGPSSRDGAAFVLRVGTSDGEVNIHLGEDEMYELWTEVQHTPWPDTLDEQDEAADLRQRLVDLAMGADADSLRDALDAIEPRWREV